MAPPSKSYTHRALMMAWLSGDCKVKRPLWGADTLSTRSCLARMGADIRGDATALLRREQFQAPSDVLDVGNSGTTLRLLTAITGLLPGTSVLTGDASIRRRPMQPLLDALRPLGVEALSTRGNGCAPIVVRGPLRGGEATLPGDVSSQFFSALLMACPLAQRESVVAAKGELKSTPYVEVTIAMQRHFGVRVEASDAGVFRVPAGQAYHAKEFTVPGDYSSAAFPLVAAAITGGRVTVKGLAPEWPQGDRFILEALRAMGAKVQERGGSATVEAHGLQGAELDLGDTPDLFPILCIAGAHAQGITTLKGAPQLRFKESDRIQSMAKGLRAMGAKVEERDDGMILHGGKPLRGAAIDTHDDHRILMAFAVAGLRAKGPVRLSEHTSFPVSYPGFLKDFKALGGKAEVRP